VSELRRIILPRTSVNKGRVKGHARLPPGRGFIRRPVGRPLTFSRKSHRLYMSGMYQARNQLRRLAVDEKIKGRAKEALGALTGDEDKKAEGQAEQKKAEAAEEAAKKAKRRQEEEEARQAERERKKQELKDKGLLGTVEDTLPKL
jgi:uncharacterized protein YjbJ (UPF0337 family)